MAVEFGMVGRHGVAFTYRLELPFTYLTIMLCWSEMKGNEVDALDLND